MITRDSSSALKLLAVFLLIGGLYLAKSFLIPLSIAALFATLFLPLCRMLEAKRIPRGIAVVLCSFILLFLVASIVTLVGWQFFELAKDFGLLKIKVMEVIHELRDYLNIHVGISFEKQKEVLNNQQPFIGGALQWLAGSLTFLFTQVILIFVYVLFLLYYRDHIKQFLLKLFPNSQKQEMESVLFSVAHVSQRYLLGLSKMIVCLWIMYGIGFSLVGIRNALFFAILCGLLEIVPFIGNITGTIITVLVAAVQGASVPMLFGIVGVYAFIQFIQGWILEPVIVGPHVKINPLFTIIALVIGELIWGLPGVFLAIPLIGMIKIVCDHIPQLQPYGFLIGEVESANGGSLLMKQMKR